MKSDVVEQVPDLGRGHRVRKPAQRMVENMQQQAENIVIYQAEHGRIEDEMEYYLNHHAAECRDQALMADLIAYKASTNQNVMYYHKTMKAPDSKQFTQAIFKIIGS